MNSLCEDVEELEDFAFEPGEWRSWPASEWNAQLLLYCFVRDQGRRSCDPLRATLSDLPLLVKDQRADAEAIAQTLVQKLRWQARQNDRDLLSQLAVACRGQRLQPKREPTFFAFLWVTCLIAHGYPDASAQGRFWDRFFNVFPRANPAHRASIDEAWELLSDWLELDHNFKGFPYIKLELPPVDTWQPHITHSWNLAFPSLRDRQQLQRALNALQGQITPWQATNPFLVEALLHQQQFSPALTARLTSLHQHLASEQPPAARTVELLERELQCQSRPSADATEPSRQQPSGPSRPRGYGSLLLLWTDDAMGVLLLSRSGQPTPAGLEVTRQSPWLPGEALLVPVDPVDPDFAPFDAGSLAIDPSAELLPALEPLLTRGLLPFALDPQLKLPRLVFDKSCGPVTHLLVRHDLVPRFLNQFSADPVDTNEEHWQCFVPNAAEALNVWQFPEPSVQDQRQDASRLSLCSGVPLQQGQGFLASGLGLPSVRVHGPLPALKVAMLSASGELIDYTPAHPQLDAGQPQLWQPVAAERKRPDISSGAGRVLAFFSTAPTIERTLSLSALASRVPFRRTEPLICREHWGRHLGPTLLTDERPAPAQPPPAEALDWSRDRLNARVPGVNQLFEQQMLDGLSALFQRRAAISRRDFQQLHDTLLSQPEHWPRFSEAVLRSWCEGGWIEEGLEPRRGQWCIQPIDPRLVRLEGGRAQLVGLLSSRGLVELLAHANSLNMDVEDVPPSCPHLPRGWRFTGRCDELAQRMGLQIVEMHEWVEPPHSRAWLFEQCEDGDGYRWPSGLGFQMATDRICGRRGSGYHVSRFLDPDLRAPVSLSIDRERSRYGRRRWHSYSARGGDPFTSCHRNRAALHALLEATNGLWPFWIAESMAGRIERLYDAEAYLPLPIGRYAALMGRRMPGPTRQQPQAHTYAYHVDEEFLRVQRDTLNLPLTSP